jgi:glycosyltransferase 2 family protein
MLRIGVSVALLSWLAWRTDWQQIGQAFASLRINLWLAAVGLYLLTQIISSLRWQLLSQPLGFQRPLRQFVAYYFIGMYFNLFLPTSVGGDVVRAWYLDGRPGQRMPAFLSVFIDRFSGLLVLLALACGMATFCPVALPAWVGTSVWITAGCALCGLLALPWTVRVMGDRLPESGSIGRRMRRFAHALAEALHLFASRPGLLVATTLLSLGVQAANVGVVWLVGQALELDVPASYYGIFVPMISLLTLAPISLNGVGVREGGTVLFLAPLGVGQAAAVSLAFLWFCVFTAASLCGGAVYLWGSSSLPPQEQPDHGSVRRDSDQGRTGQYQKAA